MLDKADVFRAAKLLVDRHGKDAPREAIERANQLAKEGDTEGVAVFSHIAAACRELLNTDRGESSLH